MIVVCSTIEKSASTAARLFLDTHCQRIDSYQANLASFHEVNALAKRVLDEYGFIDVLINNAGTKRPVSLIIRILECIFYVIFSDYGK